MERFIKLVLKKLGVYFNFSLAIKLNGVNFRIPILGGLGYANFFMTEKWMIELIKKILKIESGNFVDVGANIGQTLLKIRSVNEKIRYTGFEPNGSCIHYLKKLIRLNSIENVQIFPVGISAETSIEELIFFENNDIDSSASILKNFRKNSIKYKEFVPTFSVEMLGGKIDFGKICIIKIDVEGSELEVLEGFKKQITQCNPFILIEILPIYDKTENVDRLNRQNKIQKMMFELNYSMFRIIKKDDEFCRLLPIEDIGIHSDLDACDYIFVPNIKLDKLHECI